MIYTTYRNFDEGADIVVEFGPMTGVRNFKWGSSSKCCHGYFYLEVDRPMVGRDEEGLERSLVDAARRREELGRDVGLVGIWLCLNCSKNVFLEMIEDKIGRWHELGREAGLGNWLSSRREDLLETIDGENNLDEMSVQSLRVICSVFFFFTRKHD